MRNRYILLSLILLIASSACSQDPRKVDIVLVDGFKGIIEIIEDKESNLEIEEVDGRHILQIPKEGKVRVKSINPITNGSFLPVPRYESGTEIKISPVQDKEVKGVAFWLINHPTARKAAFFIGTRSELEAFDFKSTETFRPVIKDFPTLNKEEWEAKQTE